MPTKTERTYKESELQDFSEAIKNLQDEMARRKGDESTVEVYNERLQNLEDKLTRKFETALNRRSKFSTNGTGSNTRRVKAFFDVLKAKTPVEQEMKNSDYEQMLPSSYKTLQVGDNTLGGYLAPPEFVEEIIADVQEQNPVRGLMRQRTTQNKSVQIPRQTGFLSAQWVSELESRSETTGTTFGRVEIPAHELHAQVNVTREDLEDSAFNLEDFIRQQLAEQFGRTEAIGFINGSGNGQPEGFLVNADVTSIQSAVAASIGADDLIDLYYEPNSVFLPNSSWVLERATVKHIRKLKDGNGQYLWAAGLQNGAAPATILDRPYVMADEMPSLGSNNVVVAFGDFRRGYTVVDRIAMEVITDIFSGKSTGTVEFSARKRVGGKIVLPQAIKLLKAGA